MIKKLLLFAIVVAIFVSCTEYQKLLKSTDPELKYTKAVEYFEKKDFMRATTLFDEVSSYFKGTDRSETLLNYLANSYVGQKDYYTAGEYFKTYVRTYPKGKYVQDSKYMVAYCSYLNSPEARLDQAITHEAIAAFQEFIDFFPENEKVPDAVKLMDELYNKLAYKELLNSQLYYNLGNYLWNNYESAVIAAANALKKYPTNKYREELSFIILESKYQQALQSYENKKSDRFNITIDEYYSFVSEFPDSKKRKLADKILNEAKKAVAE
jgi:outer membrane protein assembly factor BamD